MAFDPSKLSPAPWTAFGGKSMTIEDRDGKQIHYNERDGGGFSSEDDLVFAVLSRNAFEVMMRRGWHALKDCDSWFVSGRGTSALFGTSAAMAFDDPFTALVEADKWYKENVENKS